MRRLFYLASLLAAMSLLWSCDWGFQVYQPTNPSIFVVNQNTERLEVGPESQEQVVYISSDMFWYATLKDGDWITLGDQSYYNEFTSSLSFRVQTNNSMESRTDSLIVYSGNEIRKTAIVQKGIGSLLNTNEINLYGKVPVMYQLDAKGTWSIEKEGDWFTVTPDNGMTGGILTFAASSENLDTEERKGSVTFRLGTIRLTIPVNQHITETIFVESNDIKLESTGGPFSIKTLTNVDYRVSTDAAWLHELGTRGMWIFDEPFSADPNTGSTERVGHITFTYGDLSEVVTVTQAAHDPLLSITTPGFYGVNGKNYVYTKGSCQTSRLTTGGKRAFRLIFPADICVVQLDGMPLSHTVGSSLQPTLSIHKDGILTYSQAVSVKVLAEDEKLIWLKNSENMYFILKKQ